MVSARSITVAVQTRIPNRDGDGAGAIGGADGGGTREPAEGLLACPTMPWGGGLRYLLRR